MRSLNSFFFLVWVIISSSSCGLKSENVDLVLHNGFIYTLNEQNDIKRAIAIKDGKILEVGAEHEILNKYSARAKIDLEGRPVYPGFIDAHCHFLGLGESLLWANLVNTESFEDVLDIMASYESKFSHSWILGRGWDQNDWPTQEFPTNEKLNELFPDRPVYLARIDGHAAIVNDVALELAGITCYSNVEGGEIQKENQVCTGVLVDNAMELVSKLIPEMNQKDKLLSIKLAQSKCLSAGLTSIHEAGLRFEDILLLDSAQSEGILKLGVYAMFSDDDENYSFIEKNGIIKTDKLKATSFKFYADGALGSYGACLIKPYADRAGTKGFLLKDAEYFEEKASWALDHGMQMNTHCIGDSANRVMLNIYANTLKTTNDLRWRIEHCQVVHPSDMDKFKDYNIIPSVQPLHASSDYPWFLSRLGSQRKNTAYANKDLLKQLGMIALGTDFPVETHIPLNTFYASVFRKNIEGKPVSGIQPENALTREQALKGMTIWPAIASFEENQKGTLEKGKNADLIVIDRDILKVKEEYIPKAQIYYTIISGEVVFKNDIIKK